MTMPWIVSIAMDIGGTRPTHLQHFHLVWKCLIVWFCRVLIPTRSSHRSYRRRRWLWWCRPGFCDGAVRSVCNGAPKGWAYSGVGIGTGWGSFNWEYKVFNCLSFFKSLNWKVPIFPLHVCLIDIDPTFDISRIYKMDLKQFPGLRLLHFSFSRLRYFKKYDLSKWCLSFFWKLVE